MDYRESCIRICVDSGPLTFMEDSYLMSAVSTGLVKASPLNLAGKAKTSQADHLEVADWLWWGEVYSP